MTISLANDNVASGARDSSSSSTTTVTFTHATSAGNLVVLAAGQSGTFTLSSIATDSRGNTWQIDKVSGGQGFTCAVASCLVTTPHQVNDTVVLTWSGASTFSSAVASEWSGIVNTSWRDLTASSSGISGTPTSGVTATRSQANELLYGAVSHNDASDYTAGTGIAWTLLTGKNSGAGNRKVAPEYFVAAVTGTDAATWVGSLTNFCAAIVTYKAGSGSTTPQALTATSVVSTGALAMQTNKTVAATAVLASGTLTRQTNKGMTATAALATGSLARQVTKKATASVAVTATLTRQIAKTFTATLAATGTLTKTAAKTLLATVVATAQGVVQFTHINYITSMFDPPNPGGTVTSSPDEQTFDPPNPRLG